MTVTDPTTGKGRVQRIPLVDTDGNPPRTVPQAVATVNGLVVKRRQSGLEARSRRAPRFADYTKTYLAGISAGAGTKKPRTVSTEQSYLNIWCRHLGDLRLDQIRKVHIGDFTTRRLTVWALWPWSRTSSTGLRLPHEPASRDPHTSSAAPVPWP